MAHPRRLLTLSLLALLCLAVVAPTASAMVYSGDGATQDCPNPPEKCTAMLTETVVSGNGDSGSAPSLEPVPAP
jgi:hypothetical protein